MSSTRRLTGRKLLIRAIVLMGLTSFAGLEAARALCAQSQLLGELAGAASHQEQAASSGAEDGGHACCHEEGSQSSESGGSGSHQELCCKTDGAALTARQTAAVKRGVPLKFLSFPPDRLELWYGALVPSGRLRLARAEPQIPLHISSTVLRL